MLLLDAVSALFQAIPRLVEMLPLLNPSIVLIMVFVFAWYYAKTAGRDAG